MPWYQEECLVRVISGSAKGRRLGSVSSLDTRPTSDRVKESLFNIIRNQIEDAIFLDLFAGNGGVGIEALSRGAKKVVFLEKSSLCTKMIHQNLKSTNLASKAEVYTTNVFSGLAKLGKKEKQFNIIFLDPPYQETLVDKTLAMISEYNLLAPDGIVIAEYGKKEELAQFVLNLVQVREAKYGDTVLGFYRIKGDLCEN